ncbi:hypothetical protein [Stratiformator vulcanicus]|uniref:Uncharacterized protein n=1 Tax=Stratiformator vulcanicus TaxID=2527980 RepID=A0A517R700_9PLAN|nr:hypothetical protein [Stratiformator vulcanicus]QDT39677.1 hypothetical protein Pan189_40860 [Stratiformator vulcanicus]
MSRRIADYAATGLVMIMIVLPVLHPFGLLDPWLAWRRPSRSYWQARASLSEEAARDLHLEDVIEVAGRLTINGRSGVLLEIQPATMCEARLGVELKPARRIAGGALIAINQANGGCSDPRFHGNSGYARLVPPMRVPTIRHIIRTLFNLSDPYSKGIILLDSIKGDEFFWNIEPRTSQVMQW